MKNKVKPRTVIEVEGRCHFASCLYLKISHVAYSVLDLVEIYEIYYIM